MNIKYILIIIIIILLIINIILYNKYKFKESFKICDNTSFNCYKDYIDTWFHGKIDDNCNIESIYEHNYYFDKNNNSKKNNFLLNFMCLKTQSKDKSQWNSEYNNILKIISDYIPCKSSKVYNLKDISMNNSNKHINYENIEKALIEDKKIMCGFINDNYNIDKDYSKLITNLDNIILGPVYIVLTQYPYKKMNGNTIFTNINNIHGDKARFSDIKNDKTIVDVNMIFLYPMYDKFSINFYGYELGNNKCINDYKINLPNELISNKIATIKGIVDMIKFLNGYNLDFFNEKIPINIYPSKDDKCFIKCVDNNDIFCGCSTRINNNYESICTDDHDNKINSTCLVYKLNENSETIRPYITAMNINKEIEIKITKLLVNLPCLNKTCKPQKNIIQNPI